MIIMAYSWFFFLTVLLFQGLETQAQRRYKRVVNGVNAELGEFPYMVSIQNVDSNYHHCGGTIIDKYHVLTAGHCMFGFLPDEFQVVSGTIDLGKPKFTNYVSDIYVYETYNISDSWKDDIALIKVIDPFTFNNFTAPATLSNPNQNIKIKSEVTVTGFGRVSEHDYTSKKLKKADITVEELDLCNEKYKKNSLHFRDSQICAYDPRRKGICKGDSGGPLIFNNKVIGISSFTNYGCADTDYPAVFTKVSTYIDWIRSHTNPK